MARYRPGQYTDLYAQNEELKSKIEDLEKKKKHRGEAAISRSQLRNTLLVDFCKETGLAWKSITVQTIQKVFQAKYTNNVSAAVYKRELDLLVEAFKKHGEFFIQNIVVSNHSKDYHHLVYENQVLDRSERKPKQTSTKDNIAQNKTETYGEKRSLKDFDGYRIYLKNRDDDEELREFIKNDLHINLKA